MHLEERRTGANGTVPETSLRNKPIVQIDSYDNTDRAGGLDVSLRSGMQAVTKARNESSFLSKNKNLSNCLPSL